MTDYNYENSIPRRRYLKLTGLAGAGAATGFAGTAGAQQNAVELLHGWTGGDGKEAINALESAFKETHPDVPTDFRPIGGGGNVNLNQVVVQRLANNNPPSAFANWPGKNQVQFEGVLGDITDTVWNQAGLQDVFADQAVEASKLNGKFVSVPIGSHRLNNLFYNVSVVEEAGVDPTNLSTVSDFVDALDAVSQNTDKVPMAHGMLNPWTTLQLWAAVMMGQEGFQPYMDYVNGNGDEAAVRRAFETTKEILENYINDDASTLGWPQINQKIKSGEAAFIHQGNWAAGDYKNSDLAFREDWGWVEFPGTADMYTFHLDAFLYPANNPTPENSQTFMRFAGTPKAQIAFNNLKGSITMRTDVSPDEFGEFLRLNMEDFQSVDKFPPTIAHGQAVTPRNLDNVKSVINNNFSGPFNVDAATQGMLDALK